MRASGRMGLLVLLCAGACRCGDDPALTTIFTDVVFTPDGRALVLEANDGLYVAAPPGEEPSRVAEQHCVDSPTRSLDCVRLSSDGRRIAALLRAEDAEGLPDLYVTTLAASTGSEPAALDTQQRATGVLDAAFSPDGRELVWARPAEGTGTVVIERLLSDGGAQELIASLDVGERLDRALDAVVPTAGGVAFTRLAGESAELWFAAWDAEPEVIGVLPEGCAGTGLSRCALATPDGATLAWQEQGSGIVHAYRTLWALDLPLGPGGGFSFSRAGHLALRLGAPHLVVQRTDTAAVLRGAAGAVSGELSVDGETVAYLVPESTALGTAKLFVGPSRNAEGDLEHGLFTAPDLRPLAVPTAGGFGLDHAFTADGRFIVVTERGDEGGTRLLSVRVGTGEQRVLDTLHCERCCLVAPIGALVACTPNLAGGVLQPTPLDLYDPDTGQRTRAGERVALALPLFDGSGLGVLDLAGDLPEARLVTKTGRRFDLGSALRLALSPSRPEVAVISVLGQLRVEPLP